MRKRGNKESYFYDARGDGNETKGYDGAYPLLMLADLNGPFFGGREEPREDDFL